MSPTGIRALTPAGGPLPQPIHQRDRWSPGELGVGLGGRLGLWELHTQASPGHWAWGHFASAVRWSDQGCRSTFLMGCPPVDLALSTPASGPRWIHHPAATPALPAQWSAGHLEPSLLQFHRTWLPQPRTDGSCFTPQGWTLGWPWASGPGAGCTQLDKEHSQLYNLIQGAGGAGAG